MEHDEHCHDLLAELSDYIDGELPRELCIATSAGTRKNEEAT